MNHKFNLKHRGLTTTAEGHTVSTVEQSGEWTGERVGRLWVKFADEGARWHYHGLSHCATAFTVALKLATGTEAELRDYFS